MNIRSLFILTAFLALSLYCKKSTEPLELNRYPYKLKWTIDTLTYGGSQTMMDEIWGSSADDLYVSGHSSTATYGELWHYNGKAWKYVDISHLDNGPGDLSVAGEMFGFSHDDIWIGATNAIIDHPNPTILSPVILHYDGSSWQKESIPLHDGFIQTIWGSSRNEIWAGGWGGILYKFNGFKWEYFDMQLPNFEGADEETGWHILDIHGNQVGDLYMLMRKRYKLGVRLDRIYTYTENHWVCIDSTRFWSVWMKNLWVSPSGNVYTSGAGVERWDGHSWVKLLDKRVYGFAATSETDMFACGHDVVTRIGHLYHYNGSEWLLIKEVSGKTTFTNVWTDGKEVFVIGYTAGKTSSGLNCVVTVVWHGR